ncbi:MAG: Fic family protein [Acidobacteria bacterium]|nr:Fic family protein [Acidobacteriota bacterium]
MSNHLFVPSGILFQTFSEKCSLESRNGIIQARWVVDTIENWQSDSRLTPALLLEAQRLAVNQIYRCAGHFRNGPVRLAGAEHGPPEHEAVPLPVDEMCAYVQAHWDSNAVHLASYLMWRINWIHPFFGGNGRTSRAISYLVLCARLGFVIPGTKTIPDFIVEERQPYYSALREADEAWRGGEVNVSAMEALLSSLLAKQLVSIHHQATGKDETS